MLTDTPASVSWPHAPRRMSHPWQKTTTATTNLLRQDHHHQQQSQKTQSAVHAPPSGAKDGEERDGARACVGAVVDGVGEQDGAPLRVGDGLGDAVEPLLRDDAHCCESRHVRVQRCMCGWG